MTKLRIALLTSLLLALVVANSVFADFAVVSYNDGDLNVYAPEAGSANHYISNGDFSLWEGGAPVGWTMNDQTVTPGWTVHRSQADYAKGGDGHNYALNYFIRTGSSGSQYAGAAQQVSESLVSGNYWVEVHVSAWEHNTYSPYNAVAWYGFGTSSDPSSVTTWRELYPDTYVCANLDAICNYLGRKETVHVDAGSYLHIRVGMKFPDHNAWTVFDIDDINITDADGTTALSGFLDDGDVIWNPRALR